MKETKPKKSFLPAGCGGAFAGLILWAVVKRYFGESMTWWMGVILMGICIMVGVVFQTIDEQEIKRDVIVRKNKKQKD